MLKDVKIPAFKTMLDSLLANDRRARLVIVMGVVGMVLILASSFWQAVKKEDAVSETAATSQNYVEYHQKRLEGILAKVDGVGAVDVMLTLQNGVQYIYAKDEKQSADSVTTYSQGNESKLQQKNDKQQSYILVDSSNGKRPLIVTELEPKIQGVIVVCQGAKSAVTKQNIIDVVTTALGVMSIQVCVVSSAQ